MSSIVTFEVETSKEIREIFQAIKEKWQSVSKYNEVEVIPNKNSRTMYVTLSFYYTHEKLKLQKEQAVIRSIIEYLQTIADDGKLYYFRDGFGDFPDHERPIIVDEIFTDEFEPSMNIECYRRYEIARGTNYCSSG